MSIYIVWILTSDKGIAACFFSLLTCNTFS